MISFTMNPTFYPIIMSIAWMLIFMLVPGLIGGFATHALPVRIRRGAATVGAVAGFLLWVKYFLNA